MTGSTPVPGTSGDVQLALLPVPEERPDLAWHHSRRCECQKPEGAPACGSCPCTQAWPGASGRKVRR